MFLHYRLITDLTCALLSSLKHLRNNSVHAVSQDKDYQKVKEKHKSKKGLPIVERVEHHDLEDGQDLVLVGPQHLHGGLATPENEKNKKDFI
jgi:hypothetical protein